MVRSSKLHLFEDLTVLLGRVKEATMAHDIIRNERQTVIDYIIYITCSRLMFTRAASHYFVNMDVNKKVHRAHRDRIT